MRWISEVRVWLDGRRSAWGELRFEVYKALLAFGLTFLAVGIVLSIILIPAESLFVYGDHLLSGTGLRQLVLLPYFGVVLLMTALIYFHLVRVLILPIERMRRRLRTPLAAEQPEPAAAEAGYSRREVELLEVAVQNAQRQLLDSQALMLQQAEAIERHEREGERAGQRRRALLESIGDAVVEVDDALTITAVSPAAAELVGSSVSSLLGKPLGGAVRLYDANQKDWLSHPLEEAIANRMRSDVAAPSLVDVLLLNNRNEERRLSAVVSPYGGALRRSGGTIRLQLEGSATAMRARDAQLPATLDAESGLPNNIAFRARVTELVGNARDSGRQHTAAMFVIGGMRDEDDPTDFHRNALAQVLARNLQRSADSDVELYRIGTIAYGVIKAGVAPDALRDLFETIRALCQLELSRQVGEDVVLTVRYASAEVDGNSKGIDEVMADLVAQMTGRVAVGNDAKPAKRGDGQDLAERAQWVSERLLDNRLHIVSQSVLPAAAKSGSRPWLEVFARIEDNDGHWLEPVHFLKAVEHTGEAGRLDAAVFKRVLEACASTPDLLNRYDGVSFNISAQSLADERFLNTVVEEPRRLGIAAGRFAIEIDHRAIRLTAAALAGLELLRASGIRTIVDGCNDLRSLRLMSSIQPFLVKLSGDFISAAEHDSVIGAELKAIISSAKVLGIQLSAKNVASTAQLGKLADLGIGYGQGSGLEALGPILV